MESVMAMDMDKEFSLKTELVQIKDPARQQDEIARAAQLLKHGQLVAFPTETVYGVGALALDKEAVERLYAAKNRPAGKAFSLQIADINMLPQVAAYVPQMARKLMDRFCPGPITVILPKASNVPELVTGGRNTVGIRIPDNAVALALLRAVGAPLAVPSANISGHLSPKNGAQVYGDMAGRLSMILDGGSCSIGKESTIVDCTGSRPVIVRQGAIPEAEIMAALELD